MVTFQSRASADVVMLRDLGQYLLGLVGRRLDARGVITHDQLPVAIRRLEAAIVEEERNEQLHESALCLRDRGHAPDNGLSQRAWPFLNMMREADKQHADILWGL